MTRGYVRDGWQVFSSIGLSLVELDSRLARTFSFSVMMYYRVLL
jgi:hypothetical protein